MTKRYQECNLLEKIIRSRWALLIPINIYYNLKNFSTINISILNSCWSMAIADYHYIIKYYYTSSEVKKMIEIRKNKKASK